MGENQEGEKGELMPREKYAELLASRSQAVITEAKLRRYIQQYFYLNNVGFIRTR
jgi:hypothetical protein